MTACAPRARALTSLSLTERGSHDWGTTERGTLLYCCPQCRRPRQSSIHCDCTRAVRYAGWCCGYSPAGNGTGSDRASTTAVLHSGRNAARGAGRTGIAKRHQGDVLAGTADCQYTAATVRPPPPDRGTAQPPDTLGEG